MLEIKKHLSSHLNDKIQPIISARNFFKKKKGTELYKQSHDLMTYMAEAPLSSSKDIEESCEQDIQDFFNSLNATFLNLDSVTVTELFDLYFTQTSPFSHGSKKNEFPDAVNILALSKLTNEKILIYTEDKDFSQFITNNSSSFGLVDSEINCITILEDKLKKHESSTSQLKSKLDLHTISIFSPTSDLTLEVSQLIKEAALKKLWNMYPEVENSYYFNGYVDINGYDYSIDENDINLPEMNIELPNNKSKKPLIKLNTIELIVPYSIYCTFDVYAHDAVDGGHFSIGNSAEGSFDGELTLDASIYINIDDPQDLFCEDVIVEITDHNKAEISLDIDKLLF